MSNHPTNNNSNVNNGSNNKFCCCEFCTCGPNCQCTETLCQCEASNVLNSLTGGTRSQINSSIRRQMDARTNPQSSVSCCSSSKNNSNNNYTSYNTFDNNNNDNDNRNNIPSRAETDIAIRGMTCSMCTKSIETALSNMDGVSKVNASLAFNSAHVEYDPSKIRHDDLINTIEDIGYDVVVQPQQQIVEDDDIERGATASSTKGIVEFTVSGMTCSMCSQSVVRALESTPGVTRAIVTLSTNQAK